MLIVKTFFDNTDKIQQNLQSTKFTFNQEKSNG